MLNKYLIFSFKKVYERFLKYLCFLIFMKGGLTNLLSAGYSGYSVRMRVFQ